MDVCSLGSWNYYRKMPGRPVSKFIGSIWSMTRSTDRVFSPHQYAVRSDLGPYSHFRPGKLHWKLIEACEFGCGQTPPSLEIACLPVIRGLIIREASSFSVCREAGAFCQEGSSLLVVPLFPRKEEADRWSLKRYSLEINDC